MNCGICSQETSIHIVDSIHFSIIPFKCRFYGYYRPIILRVCYTPIYAILNGTVYLYLYRAIIFLSGFFIFSTVSHINNNFSLISVYRNEMLCLWQKKGGWRCGKRCSRVCPSTFSLWNSNLCTLCSLADQKELQISRVAIIIFAAGAPACSEFGNVIFGVAAILRSHLKFPFILVL